MSKPIDIDFRFAHIPDDGPMWRVLNSEYEWTETQIPKKFAATPELAVELLEFIVAKQTTAINSGYESGRRSMQYDLRKLIGAAPASNGGAA